MWYRGGIAWRIGVWCDWVVRQWPFFAVALLAFELLAEWLIVGDRFLYIVVHK